MENLLVSFKLLKITKKSIAIDMLDMNNFNFIICKTQEANEVFK